MDDLIAADDQRASRVGQGTKDKESRVWRRWCEYCHIIDDEHDLFLQDLPSKFHTRLLGAFTAALQRCQFSKPDERPLGSSTVEEAVAKLGQIFRANVGYNPAHGDLDGGIHPSLARQFRGMKNNALPVCVYREICWKARSPFSPFTDITIAWLLILTFFFCM
jgi:hypothetical protein